MNNQFKSKVVESTTFNYGGLDFKVELHTTTNKEDRVEFSNFHLKYYVLINDQHMLDDIAFITKLNKPRHLLKSKQSAKNFFDAFVMIPELISKNLETLATLEKRVEKQGGIKNSSAEMQEKYNRIRQHNKDMQNELLSYIE